MAIKVIGKPYMIARAIFFDTEFRVGRIYAKEITHEVRNALYQVAARNPDARKVFKTFKNEKGEIMLWRKA